MWDTHSSANAWRTTATTAATSTTTTITTSNALLPGWMGGKFCTRGRLEEANSHGCGDTHSSANAWPRVAPRGREWLPASMMIR